MTEEQEREWFDRHEAEHEDPRDHADDCDLCLVRWDERAADGEYDGLPERKRARLLAPGDHFTHRAADGTRRTLRAAEVNVLSHRVSIRTDDDEWITLFPEVIVDVTV